MRPEIAAIAKELGLFKEYKLIRAQTGEVVKEEDRLSPEHQRILEAAYKAGYEAGLKEKHK
jgi:hypothetical protein